MAWLDDQNNKISDLIDWIEEQKALSELFPTDPFLIEMSEDQEYAKASGLLEVS